jgi:transcriptional regulator with XRE-family HTH domain
MRRGTPSAELFGDLLGMIRTVGTGDSMRQVGDKIGAPAATVSQIEKGQRALKEPKIAVWAAALGVSEADLHELWVLSQGLIPVGDRLVFYSDRPDALGAATLSADIVKTLGFRPDLEPIFRVAERITAVLKPLLPNAGIGVDPEDFERLHEGKEYGGLTLTAAEQDEQAEHEAAFVPLPIIECHWDNRPGRPEPWEVNDRYRVRVPLLQKLTPIVRRRGRSVNAVELEDLIRDLSGPERERVRGYVEAIVEQRADPDD